MTDSLLVAVLNRTTYRGVQTVKLPLDLWVYHQFAVDAACEKYGLTYNPSGFLTRVREK